MWQNIISQVGDVIKWNRSRCRDGLMDRCWGGTWDTFSRSGSFLTRLYTNNIFYFFEKLLETSRLQCLSSTQLMTNYANKTTSVKVRRYSADPKCHTAARAYSSIMLASYEG